MADHAAVTFLLEQVTEVIRGYADLVSGADKEFKKLKQDVIELKDVLQDTSTTSTEDKSVRTIKNEIRSVVYEVEDSIDACLTEIKGKSRFSRPAANLSFAKKVKHLREGEVKEMLEKANKMKVLLQTVGTGKGGEVKERMVNDPEIRKDKVVGLKDEEDTIKGYLMQQHDELDIIPVIGMPGLGKTTLTWKIYNDELIRYEFPIRIWVHFSQRFNSTDVLIEIMRHFTANMDELHSMGKRELCDKVHTCLSQDRFLLVVDDVWRTEHWDEIIHALPSGNARGKVMITSREKNVGNHVKRITKPHMQRPLNQDESWELLQLEVFGRLGDCPYTLQDIGKAIADKCKGIPMTIVVLGGVLKDHYLATNSDVLVKEKWGEVATKDLDLEDKAQVIKDVVALSYHRLPERMRECFLYLGVFPAGYVVQTWTLKQLWIAEGFIQPDGKNSLDKIAEEILNDLISRNLLIVHEINPMQEVKVCRVHDVIRMFCTDEAEKQILFKDVKSTTENIATLKDADHMEMVHRLCLHSDLNKVFRMKVTGKHVRSFLSFRKDAAELDAENVSAIFESFPKLRILQSQSVKFKNFPPRLIKLNHLRYIVLCVSDLEIVPEQISLLWNLQTIIIHTNSESLKMRASLWKMIRLKHLKTKAAILLEKKFESGDPEGVNLQTLKRVNPESVPEVAKRATKLKTLGIQGKLTSLFLDMPLGNLNDLEKLKLYQTVAHESKLANFPNSNCFPPNLQRLTLSKTFLEWKHMSTLAMIQSLKVLKLKENAFTGISWEAEKHNSFGKLQVLHMLYLDLVIWSASDSTFPCLRHLELKNCEKLNTIPDDKLQSLESMDVGRVRKPIADAVKNFAAQKTNATKNSTFQLKLSAELMA